MASPGGGRIRGLAGPVLAGALALTLPAGGLLALGDGRWRERGAAGAPVSAAAAAHQGVGVRAASARAEELARQVVIRRTAYGVPHVLARNLAAAAFGLAYCQLEDYGMEVVRRLLEGRGEGAKYFGRGELEGDFARRLARARAVETYGLLDQDTRDVMEGFAAGVNHYIALHAGEFPEWVKPDFTAYDVAARDVGGANWGAARAFVRRMGPGAPGQAAGVLVGEERVGRGPVHGAASRGGAGQGGHAGLGVRGSGPGHAATLDLGERIEDDGSNAWAFAPARTKSGRAILLRNPHLAWTAGYYEAQLTVPGKLNFYGDFRIGGPFTIIGGFNEYLGWSTTNNAPDLDVIYELAADPERADHYLWDGASVPLRREEITVEVRDGEGGVVRETRELWFSALGPVIHRDGERIYVIKSADDGEYRRGQQFLRMMRARSLGEWKDAMRMRAIAASNFTYADRDGNIFYVWNAKLPALPHAPDGGSAVAAHGASDVWTNFVPFDELPQLLNPPGGYLQNSNDPPYYTNLHAILDRRRYPANMPEPRLRLRTQHSLQLVDTDERLGLEDVLALKHSMRMILADRVKDDLLAAVLEARPDPEVRAALDVIGTWDNRAAPESRGAVLFETWFRRYTATADTSAWFRVDWTPERPTDTPWGLGDPERATEAFAWAVAETKRRYGRWDVSWGEVHRVRRGAVDVPVGGCSGTLGCFRVLNFREEEEGRRVANGGDGWILAVEFSDPPRAYSVLAYGQSPRPDSPHHADQAELFARNGAKHVAFTEEQIARRLLRQYHPGEEIPRVGRRAPARR